MVLELPVNEKHFNSLRDMHNDKRDFVLFKIVGLDDTACIHAHGSNEGFVQLILGTFCRSVDTP